MFHYFLDFPENGKDTVERSVGIVLEPIQQFIEQYNHRWKFDKLWRREKERRKTVFTNLKETSKNILCLRWMRCGLSWHVGHCWEKYHTKCICLSYFYRWYVEQQVFFIFLFFIFPLSSIRPRFKNRRLL